MGKLHLIIATPSNLIVREEVDEVTAPGFLGTFGVLPAHTAFLSQLKTGEVSYRVDKKKQAFWISGGYCEVLDDKVTILAHKAKKIEDVDKAEVGERAKAKV